MTDHGYYWVKRFNENDLPSIAYKQKHGSSWLFPGVEWHKMVKKLGYTEPYAVLEKITYKETKMSEDKKEATGWECPRCGSVNAPQIEKCKCVKNEDKTVDPRQLLTE